MNRIIRAALAVVALTAAPALAFDGVYGESCVPQGDNVPMTIRGDLIIFYESECRMTNPVNVRDMDGAVLFDLECDGEGMTWQERAFLQPSLDGGLIYATRGMAWMLPRCE